MLPSENHSKKQDVVVILARLLKNESSRKEAAYHYSIVNHWALSIHAIAKFAIKDYDKVWVKAGQILFTFNKLV
jgi:hypothetical protein